MTINFLRPFVLWFIPIAIGLAVILRRIGWRESVRLAAEFGQAERLERMRRKQLQSLLLFAAFLVMGFVALAGPSVVGEAETRSLRVILVLDVSHSGGAREYGPPFETRFERGKLALRELLRRYPKGEAGLVVFAGEAFIQVARLRDLAALEWMIASDEWVELGRAPGQGSAIQSGLEKALELARETYKNDVVVVLVSDGDEAAAKKGAVKKAAAPLSDVLQQYKTARIPVVVAGIGKAEGSPVVLDDKKVHHVKLNEPLLREIASATGGEYARIVTGKEIAEMFSRRPEFFRTMKERAPRDLYRIPLGFAIALFAAWFFRSVRP